jgi:hypothetical protein
VAVALKTKLATAARRLGLLPRLAAEDLVAVAETTREPAATEAAVAWAAADTAAVGAVVAAAPHLAMVAADAAVE